jgi:iron(III) transport system permease protein
MVRGLLYLLLAVLVAIPLAALASVIRSNEPASVRALTDPITLVALRHSLLVSAFATVLAAIVGCAGALATERLNVPGRRWLRLGLVSPLLVPAFATGLGWSQAYAPAGLLSRVAGISLPGVLGPTGVTLAVAVEAMPLAYLVLAAGLRSRLEPDLERAARVSGAGPLVTLRTVTLPLLRPAVLAAFVLAFVAALTSFAIPAALGLGAGFSTMTTLIYQDLSFASDNASFIQAVTLAALLVVIAAGLVLVTDLAVGPGFSQRTGVPSGAEASAPPAGGGRIIAALLWLVVAGGCGFPLLALALTALTRAPGLAPLPRNWSLDNFASGLSGGHTADALSRTLLLAILSASILLLLGLLLARLERGRRGFLGSVVTLTLILPGSTLAVGMMLAYGSWLAGSLIIILLAYLAKLWALAHRSISGPSSAIPDDLERAGRASGASAGLALRTITLPLLRPALFAAWLLVFIFAFHELTMASLLYGPGSETYSVVVLNTQELGDVGTTAALACLLTAAVLVAAIPLLHLWDWRSNRRPVAG